MEKGREETHRFAASNDVVVHRNRYLNAPSQEEKTQSLLRGDGLFHYNLSQVEYVSGNIGTLSFRKGSPHYTVPRMILSDELLTIDFNSQQAFIDAANLTQAEEYIIEERMSPSEAELMVAALEAATSLEDDIEEVNETYNDKIEKKRNEYADEEEKEEDILEAIEELERKRKEAIDAVIGVAINVYTEEKKKIVNQAKILAKGKVYKKSIFEDEEEEDGEEEEANRWRLGWRAGAAAEVEEEDFSDDDDNDDKKKKKKKKKKRKKKKEEVDEEEDEDEDAASSSLSSKTATKATTTTTGKRATTVSRF